MASVAELSDLYSNFMFGPRAGPGVCSVCFNFTDGYDRCYACARGPEWLDAVAPISYSVAHEQLHHALASYKRMQGEAARRLGVGLAAVLWRALSAHEPCVTAAAGVRAFSLVATVPSSNAVRDREHPLRWIVSELVGPTRARHERLLRRSDIAIAGPRVRRPQVRGNPGPGRRPGAADRRHLDDRRQCAKRSSGAQGGGGRPGRRGGHRPPPQPQMAPE
jgi:hypothetical protein